MPRHNRYETDRICLVGKVSLGLLIGQLQNAEPKFGNFCPRIYLVVRLAEPHCMRMASTGVEATEDCSTWVMPNRLATSWAVALSASSR